MPACKQSPSRTVLSSPMLLPASCSAPSHTRASAPPCLAAGWLPQLEAGMTFFVFDTNVILGQRPALAAAWAALAAGRGRRAQALVPQARWARCGGNLESWGPAVHATWLQGDKRQRARAVQGCRECTPLTRPRVGLPHPLCVSALQKVLQEVRFNAGPSGPKAGKAGAAGLEQLQVMMRDIWSCRVQRWAAAVARAWRRAVTDRWSCWGGLRTEWCRTAACQPRMPSNAPLPRPGRTRCSVGTRARWPSSAATTPFSSVCFTSEAWAQR